MDWRRSDSGVRWLEAELGPATVAFPARTGGVSEGPFESLNLGISTGDEPALVSENRRRLMLALGLESTPAATARQVHGDRVLQHDASEGEVHLGSGAWRSASAAEEEADAHVANSSGLALVVLTADCLPVAVYGSRGLGLAHCGWRGLEVELAGKIAAEVRADRAVLGPSIGPCCYSVGPEVAARFEEVPGAIVDGRLDIRAVARAQLEAEGVAQIEQAEICTSCDEEALFSHRRDGAASGRGGAVAWLN